MRRPPSASLPTALRMTQPPLDLPDPLHPPATGAPAGTDDLLSQMAGDEINRLLAQSDGDLPAAPPAARTPTTAAAAAATPPAAPDPAAAGALDVVGSAPAPTTGGPAGPLSDAMISQELDQVFARQVSADGPGPGREASGADTLSADGVTDLLGRLGGGDAPAGAGLEHGHRPERSRGGVEPELAASASAGSGVAPADPIRVVAADPATAARRRGRWVRWAVLPLDPFPDRMRDVVGKVAIVTTLNAVAVLIYVLLFR